MPPVEHKRKRLETDTRYSSQIPLAANKNISPREKRKYSRLLFFLHVRKLICPCGHIFSTKSNCCLFLNNSNKKDQETMKSEREIIQHQSQKRALETECESEQHRKTDAARQAYKRTLETEYEREQLRKANRLRSAKKSLKPFTIYCTRCVATGSHYFFNGL